jgi:hypothetical protein
MDDAAPDRVNLFVVGVNKAGTSWLYELLDAHPQVFMSAEKELHYFGEDHPDRRAAYHAHFPFEKAGRPYRYFGEATPFYCHGGAAVARQIRDYAPGAKVLAIVRDPVARLRSQFRYHKQLGYVREEAGPEALLGEAAAELRANSHYEKLLPPFAEAFGPDQFKLVSLEAAHADVPALWEELQAFLDVRRIPPPSLGNHASNATGSRAFRAVYRWGVHPLKRRFPVLYRALLRSSAARTAKRLLLHLLGTDERGALPAPVAAALRKEFRPTYRYLAERGFDDVYATPLTREAVS